MAEREKTPDHAGISDPSKGAEDPKALLSGLKRQIARLEGRLSDEEKFERPVGPTTGTATDDQIVTDDGLYSFGLDALDRLFTGRRLPLHALHEIISPVRTNGVASAFIFALLARLMGAVGSGPVIWISSHWATQEMGGLYGPGLAEFGFDPARLLIVNARNDRDVLWATEEAASLREAIAIVMHMKSGNKDLSLTASRRLHLRAEANKTPIFTLLSGTDPPGDTIALTRWQVKAAPSANFDSMADSPGHAAFTANLTRNRRGQTGHADLLWNATHGRFEDHTIKRHDARTHEPGQAPSTAAGAVVPLSFHRPAGAA